MNNFDGLDEINLNKTEENEKASFKETAVPKIQGSSDMTSSAAQPETGGSTTQYTGPSTLEESVFTTLVRKPIPNLPSGEN